MNVKWADPVIVRQFREFTDEGIWMFWCSVNPDKKHGVFTSNLEG